MKKMFFTLAIGILAMDQYRTAKAPRALLLGTISQRSASSSHRK